ncbi:MAG: MIP/aquaporin family protein [Paracoccaceae bacterium]
MNLRALVAEGLGTLLLVVAVIGSAIMAGQLTQDGGVLLLANSLATGAALLVLITIFAPLSGAQFNPAVSLVLALRAEIGWTDCAAFIMAQSVGGVAGTLIAHAMFDLPLLQISGHIRTGAAQYLAEAIATFGLILTILGSQYAKGANVALMVASYITAAYWFTASTSFANPVMALARSLTNTPAGIRPTDAPAFVVAEVLGAVLAMVLGSWLFRTPDQAG